MATFNSTSTANAAIDAAASVAGISIASTYTGVNATITQNAGITLTIGSSGYSQAAGTFTGGNSTIDLNGAFSLTGGTFTSTSGTMTISGSFTVSGSPTFTHNSGTVTFSGGSRTLSCNNISFNRANISGTVPGDYNLTINSDCNLPLGDSPTIKVTDNAGQIILNGTLSGTGTLTSTIGGITVNSGGSLSGFSGLVLGTSSYGRLTIAGGALDLTSYTTVTINSNFTLSSGTFTAPSGLMTVNGNFTISGGTFNANTGSLTFGGTNATSQTISCNNATFNSVTINKTWNQNTLTLTISSDCNLPLGASPTVTFANGSATLNLVGTLSGTGTLTLSLNNASSVLGINGGTLSGFSGLVIDNNFTLTSGTANLGSYTTVDINRNFTLTSGTFTAPSGTMTVAGNFTINGGTFSANGGTLTFDGANNPTYSCNNATFNSVNISNGVSNITVNSNCNLPLGNNPTVAGRTLTLYGTLSGTGTLTSTLTVGLTLGTGAALSGFNGAATLAALTISGATVDFSSYSTFNLGGSFTFSSGSFTAPPTMTLNTNGNSTFTCGSTTFNDVVMNKGAPSITLTLASDCTFGSFTLTQGTVANPSSAYTLNLTGDLIHTSATTFGGANLTVQMSGSNTQTITPHATASFASVFKVNKSGGSVKIGTRAFTVTGQSCNVVEGVFNLGGQTFTCSIGFTVEDGGTLQMYGSETPTAPTLSSGSTVKYTGDGGSDADAYTLKDWDYHHLTIASTDSGDTFATPNTTEDANGNFTVSGGVFTAPSGNFTIGGSFAHSGGTFTHNSGSIVLDGTSQQITGSTTFNNLSKTVTSADTLTFGAGDTQTIAGTMTLKGAASNLLSLRSSSTDTQWRINPQGTRTIEYLDVKDSYNTNSTTIATSGLNITNSGNNTGWNFLPDGDPSSFSGTAAGTTSITWSWTNNATNANGFYVKNTSGTTVCTVTSGSTTSCTETSLSPNTSYTRYVVAYNDNGNSGSSSNASATTRTVPSPSLDSPGDNSYTSSTRPSFKFKAPTDDTSTKKYSDVSSYRLYVKDYSGTEIFSISGIPASRTTDYTDNSRYVAHYDGFSDSDITNNYITVYTKSSSSWGTSENDGKLKEGKITWGVASRDSANNEASTERTVYLDTTSPTLSNLSISDSLGEKDNYQVIIKKTPTIKGTIADTYYPDKISLALYKESFFLGVITSADLVTTQSQSLNNTTSTSLDFSISVSPELDYGSYQADVTGFDKAGNKTTSTIKFKLVTAQQAEQLLKGQLSEEKKKTIREQTQVSLPELEKKAILRREKEAAEFDKLIQQAQDQFAFLGKIGGSSLAFIFDGIKTTTYNLALLTQNIASGISSALGNTAANIANTTTSLSKGISESVSKQTEIATSAIGNSLLAMRNSVGSGYNNLAQGAPGVIKNAMLVFEKGANTVGSTISSTNRLALDTLNKSQTNLQNKVSKTSKETTNLISGLGNGTVNFISSAAKSTTDFIASVNTGLTNSQKEASKQIAQTHQSTSDFMKDKSQRIGKGITLAFRSFQKPVNNTADLLDRTKVWLLTFESVVIDSNPTMISDVHIEELGKDYAVVSWNTNHYAWGKVNYGKDLTYGQEVILTKREKVHTARLTGLKPGEKYYFEVMSQNKNYAYDAYYSFETKK